MSFDVFSHPSQEFTVPVASDDAMVAIATEKAANFTRFVVVVDRECLSFVVGSFWAYGAFSPLRREEFIILF